MLEWSGEAVLTARKQTDYAVCIYMCAKLWRDLHIGDRRNNVHPGLGTLCVQYTCTEVDSCIRAPPSSHAQK